MTTLLEKVQKGRQNNQNLKERIALMAGHIQNSKLKSQNSLLSSRNEIQSPTDGYFNKISMEGNTESSRKKQRPFSDRKRGKQRPFSDKKNQQSESCFSPSKMSLLQSSSSQQQSKNLSVDVKKSKPISQCTPNLAQVLSTQGKLNLFGYSTKQAKSSKNSKIDLKTMQMKSKIYEYVIKSGEKQKKQVENSEQNYNVRELLLQKRASQSQTNLQDSNSHQKNTEESLLFNIDFQPIETQKIQKYSILEQNQPKMKQLQKEIKLSNSMMNGSSNQKAYIQSILSKQEQNSQQNIQLKDVTNLFSDLKDRALGISQILKLNLQALRTLIQDATFKKQNQQLECEMLINNVEEEIKKIIQFQDTSNK